MTKKLIDLNRMLNNAGQKYQMYIYSSTFKHLVVNKISKINYFFLL